MLPTQLKSFWAGIILLFAALLPWRIGFATVTDEKIQAAKDLRQLR